MTLMRAMVAVLVCVTFGLSVGQATGQAEGGKVKTRITMKMKCDFGTCQRAKRASTPGSFSGKVRSADKDCVDGREVKVIRKGGPAPGPVGSTKAGKDGSWNLSDGGLLEGTYRAKTGKAPGCKTGRSKKWTVTFM
jgi:hypothetical protein